MTSSPKAKEVPTTILVVNEEEWVENMLVEAKKNRKVSIDDIIHATIDIHKFRGKEDPKAKAKGKPEEEESSQPKDLKPSSPRSLKACLELGIDPTEVVYKPLNLFPNKNPELQQIEYDQFEAFRRNLLEKLREKRNAIIQAENSSGAGPAKPGAAAKKGDDGEDLSGMIEKEKKRIEAQQKRNKREMANMLSNEAKLAKSRQAEEAKQARLRELEEQRLAELKRQEAEYRRQQKERDLERQKREADEIEEIKKASIEHFKKQQALAEALEQQRLRRLEEQKLEEERRQAKAQQQRADLERILKEEQEKLMAKQKIMEEREKERQKMIAIRKAERIKANAEKRAATDAKVKTAIEAGNKVAEERKQQIQNKMLENERRLAALAKQHVEDEKRRRAENEEKARQRLDKFEEAKNIEAERIDHILERQAAAGLVYDEFQKKYQFHQDKHKVKRKLMLEERKAKVEEMKRAAAFKRHAMRQKIEEDTVRARQLTAQKEALQERRRMANIDASMQRQILNSAMEQMKVKKRWNALNLGAPLDLKAIQEALRPVSAPLPASSNLLKGKYSRPTTSKAG